MRDARLGALVVAAGARLVDLIDFGAARVRARAEMALRTGLRDTGSHTLMSCLVAGFRGRAFRVIADTGRGNRLLGQRGTHRQQPEQGSDAHATGEPAGNAVNTQMCRRRISHLSILLRLDII
jgi:hypothetical protein